MNPDKLLVVLFSFFLTCWPQDYKEKPDYGRCVAIVASASLREMIKPGALAIVSPIVVGGSIALC